MNSHLLLVYSFAFSISALAAMDSKLVTTARIPESDSIYAISLLDAFMHGAGAITSASNNQICFPHAHQPGESLLQPSLQAYTLLEKLSKEKATQGPAGDMAPLILRAKRLYNLSDEAAVDQCMKGMSCDQELELVIRAGTANLFKGLFEVSSQNELTARILEGDEEGEKVAVASLQEGESIEKITRMCSIMDALPKYLGSRYALLQALKSGISSEINAASAACSNTELFPSARIGFRKLLLESVSQFEFKKAKKKEPFVILLSTALEFARSNGYPTFIIPVKREHVLHFIKYQLDQAMIQCTTTGRERPDDECRVEFNTAAPLTPH